MWKKVCYSPGKGMAAGLIAGLFASWVMSEFQAGMKKAKSKLQERSADDGWPQEPQQQQTSGDDSEPATVQVAVAISHEILRRELPEEYKKPAAQLVHYAYGMVIGGMYGLVAENSPVVTAGYGAVFGAAVWLGSDEIAVPALGFAKGPRAYPISTHAYALASHAVYGVATEFARRFLRRGYLAC